MSKNIFITGNSAGLGYGLTQYYLAQGHSVYGCSRSGCNGLEGALHDYRCDLSQLDQIPAYLDDFLGQLDSLDLVILNAGILGPIRDLHETPLAEVKNTFDINVWSNKVILDWLYARPTHPAQIVLISSGAAVNGNRGWNGYAISKAALNMLTAQYACEFTDTHMTAFAPGLVHTQMQDVLCEEVDSDKFPSIKSLQNAMGSEAMPSPEQAGKLMAEAFARLPSFPTGQFLDIRSI